jgi:hypothetical protein
MMALEAKDVSATEPEQFEFQFGLSTLLIVMVLVAVACSLFFQIPPIYATFALIAISLALPAVLCTVLVYGRGYRRTFCLGALFPSGVMLVCTSLMVMIHAISAYQNDISLSKLNEFAEKVAPYYLPFVATAWIAGIQIGMLCVLVRLLVERANRNARKGRSV